MAFVAERNQATYVSYAVVAFRFLAALSVKVMDIQTFCTRHYLPFDEPAILAGEFVTDTYQGPGIVSAGYFTAQTGKPRRAI